MIESNRFKITSDDYADIIIETARSMVGNDPDNMIALNEKYSVTYLPVEDLGKDSINHFGYEGFPSCFNLTSTIDLEASGVTRIQRVPALNLRGKDVLVGFVDTGIDYTHPAFQHTDGTTRILSLWDQTIQSEESYPAEFFYGTEYNEEQINLALRSTEPMEIVPSTDMDGHGTMLAGVTAGTESVVNGFSGVVPDADLLVVKLREAKPFNKDFFLIPEEAVCYMETDIILAINYLLIKARELERPIAICIGLGTNQGGHDNKGVLSSIVTRLSGYAGVCLVTSAGNELNQSHHYYGVVEENSNGVVVELNIGNSRPSFSLEIWSSAAALLNAEVISSIGESILTTPSRLIETRRKDFVFEDTILWANNISFEAQTGDQLILLRFQNPTPGVWRLHMTSRDMRNAPFHMWLPAKGFIPEDTVFLLPNPNTIVQSPGNSGVLITVGAYNSRNNSIYVNSSRGPNRQDYLRPDLCAPGVEVLVPNLAGSYSTGTGTGLAAAQVTGISAMLLEWGIVRGNMVGMGTPEIKTLLIRGTVQDPGITYPNNSWGYGRVNIYNSFQSLLE